MNVNTLYVMVAIIDLILCLTLAYIGLSRKMSTAKIFGSLALVTCLSLFIINVPAENIKRTDNIDTYNVSVTSVQNIERQTSGDKVKYTDDSGNENKVVISATKYDSDKTLTCFLKHVIIVEQTTDISRCFGYFYCSRGICHV